MWIIWCILVQDVQEILYPKGNHVSFVSKGFFNSALYWFRDLVRDCAIIIRRGGGDELRKEKY